MGTKVVKRAARTATGKRVTPEARAGSERRARAVTRAHLEDTSARAKETGLRKQPLPAAAVIDESLRDYDASSKTCDEELLQSRTIDEDDFLRSDPWRVMRITGEMV